MPATQEIDRKLLVKDSEFLTLKDVFEIYETGKNRRYNLLFAVNGGAFAVLSFLVTEAPIKHGNLVIIWIGLAMVTFSAVMGYDIYKFGFYMRHLSGNLKLFGRAGQRVLKLIVSLLIVAWVGAAIAAKISN